MHMQLLHLPMALMQLSLEPAPPTMAFMEAVVIWVFMELVKIMVLMDLAPIVLEP